MNDPNSDNNLFFCVSQLSPLLFRFSRKRYSNCKLGDASSRAQAARLLQYFILTETTRGIERRYSVPQPDKDAFTCFCLNHPFQFYLPT